MEAINNTQLINFLNQARATVSGGGATRFVMGNESADLDSMASAVAYSYYTSTQAGTGAAFLPLVNVPRADYKLRTEATFLFSAVGIQPEMLTFIDEVDLEALHAAGKLQLILVDHNALSAGQRGLSGAVAGIVDHHKDEGGFADVSPRVIEPVGSASTLVAEALLAGGATLEAGLAKLLVGTILLDTVNLDPEAKRATEKDVQVVDTLLAACGADRKELFDRLQFEKFNVASLDTSDLLRKDYKEFQMGAVRCGIASVLLPIAKWLEKDADIVASLEAFAAQNKLDLLLAMNAYTDPEFRRELVVWAADAGLRERVITFFLGSDLGLKAIEGANVPAVAQVAFYSQGHAGYSRKKLQPLLQGFLEG